jgi:hypothetical protein
MTLCIIFSVRGSLKRGGSFISGRSGNPMNGPAYPTTFTLDDLRTKPESEWVVDPDNKHLVDRKTNLVPEHFICHSSCLIANTGAHKKSFISESFRKSETLHTKSQF